jgi:DNA-binding NtrC family response regulator
MDIRILIVEDDPHLREVLLETAALDGYRAVGVQSAEDALEQLAGEAFDIVVTDINLPAMSGLDLLPEIARLRPETISIVITAYGTIDKAVEAMKRGATDFFAKPFELDIFSATIRVAAERIGSRRRRVAAPDEILDETMIAASPGMRGLLEQAAAFAPLPISVLITGETGTGKELLARYIHEHSPRRKRPLIALNCAAVPDQLLEDELFGHVKGAFTGAQNAREGRFEQADTGTLFLDEIGDMDLSLQSKLLRVLQERKFEKLGSSRTVEVDVRVVSATSADLARRIEEGSFRADLFYRLNVAHLHLPPLRERPEDMRLLAESLLARFCRNVGLPAKTIDEAAWSALMSYRWPGNVRQLQNAMERAAAVTGAATLIRLQDLPEEARGGAHSGVTPVLSRLENAPPPMAPPGPTIPEGGLNFDETLSNLERKLLLESLTKTGGNKMQAAKLLNMKRTTFVEKLKKLQIEKAEPEQSEES